MSAAKWRSRHHPQQAEEASADSAARRRRQEMVDELFVNSIQEGYAAEVEFIRDNTRCLSHYNKRKMGRYARFEQYLLPYWWGISSLCESQSPSAPAHYRSDGPINSSKAYVTTATAGIVAGPGLRARGEIAERMSRDASTGRTGATAKGASPHGGVPPGDLPSPVARSRSGLDNRSGNDCLAAIVANPGAS